jgi:hypothetical protein
VSWHCILVLHGEVNFDNDSLNKAYQNKQYNRLVKKTCIKYLLVFMRTNLYRGGHKIERTKVTQETQGVLDGFGSPRG